LIIILIIFFVPGKQLLITMLSQNISPYINMLHSSPNHGVTRGDWWSSLVGEKND